MRNAACLLTIAPRRPNLCRGSKRFFPALALVAACTLVPLFGAAANARPRDAGAAQPQPDPFLQGKLVKGAGAALSVQTAAGSVAVTSDDAALLHTLEDSRLAGREVRLLGERKSGGAFDAEHLFTVRDGKLYRLRFYCHVCNIPATEPGPCVCCQRPTELEEIPAEQVTDDMVMVP